MKAAWKKGNKQLCTDMGLKVGERSQLSTASDSHKASIDAIVARQGCVLISLGAASQEPQALVRDDATGRLFDSLSDDDVNSLCPPIMLCSKRHCGRESSLTNDCMVWRINFKFFTLRSRYCVYRISAIQLSQKSKISS
jgi:hypothetical protein